MKMHFFKEVVLKQPGWVLLLKQKKRFKVKIIMY